MLSTEPVRSGAGFWRSGAGAVQLCLVTGIRGQPPLLPLPLLEYPHRDLLLDTHCKHSSCAFCFVSFTLPTRVPAAQTPPPPLRGYRRPPNPGAGCQAIPARLTKRASCSTHIRFVDMRSGGPVSFLPSQRTSRPQALMMCSYYPAAVGPWTI